jgi:very-short-patch-repair endonuclease
MGEQPARDERRDAWLVAKGIATLRILAADVLADPDGVADANVRTGVERA